MKLDGAYLSIAEHQFWLTLYAIFGLFVAVGIATVVIAGVVALYERYRS